MTMTTMVLLGLILAWRARKRWKRAMSPELGRLGEGCTNGDSCIEADGSVCPGYPVCGRKKELLKVAGLPRVRRGLSPAEAWGSRVLPPVDPLKLENVPSLETLNRLMDEISAEIDQRLARLASNTGTVEDLFDELVRQSKIKENDNFLRYFIDTIKRDDMRIMANRHEHQSRFYEFLSPSQRLYCDKVIAYSKFDDVLAPSSINGKRSTLHELLRSLKEPA